MSKIFLSLIIPAYNEEHRLPKTLEQAHDFFSNQQYSYEVLVVENGSHDHTLAVAQEFANRYTGFHVMQSERGKGNAVKKGMLEAQGEFRFMCDADLSMPIDQINRFIPPILQDFDLAIASREAPGSVRYDEPLYRHLGGRMVNGMIRLLALPGMHDTQCGFKCFRAKVAEDLFNFQTLPGMSFDIELLFVARLRGYKVIEVPIPWYFSSESKVNILRDTWQMMWDILSIRRKARQGLYRQHES